METHKDILLWLKSVSRKNGLPQRLSYKNVSLWWFDEFPLSVFITDILRNKRGESAYDIAKKYVYKLPLLVTLYFLVKAVAIFILGKLLTGSHTIKSNGLPKIMAVSYTGLWRPHPQLEGRERIRTQDVILGDILTSLRNIHFDLVALYTDSSLFIDLKTIVEKNSAERGLWKPIETYLTFGIIKTAFSASRRYKKEWNKLQNSQEFISSLNYKGIPLFDSLKDYLRTIFEQNTFERVLLIELMERAIEVEKPVLILVAGEGLSLGKAAVIVGKLKRIPTLAVQHGNLNPNYPEPLHIKDEISARIAPEYCPLPDKTAVYGPWTKKVLIQDCNYPEGTVVVTGQPRYDILAKADKIFSKDEFCLRYGLNPNNKIALICTENLPIFEENTFFLRAILKVFKELPEVQVVIKPHQFEKGKWYERIAKEEKASALILPKKFNTYLSMYACNVMLAFFSTTITEALILNKPVVVVNLTGRPDPMPYVESGVAVGAYKQEDIASAIKDILYNKDVGQKLAQARKEFVYEHAYIQDGHATKRVTELVKQMLGSKHINDR
ncbi:MAG: hypothetical protein FJZ16_08865 [Candidatus Omnitrophica bacterium]|nr:hypothetical protein [Candidatus Omnitrophota bacterium]